MPAWWQYLGRLKQSSSEGYICSQSIYAISHIARVHGSRNQSVEIRIAFCSHNPMFYQLWDLSSTERDTSNKRNSNDFIDVEVPSSQFGLPTPWNQQADKALLFWLGKLDCYSSMEIRKSISRIQGNPLGYLLVLPSPVIKANEKLQQPNPARTTNGPDSLGIKVWVTSLGKEPWSAEVLAELGKGKAEWLEK